MHFEKPGPQNTDDTIRLALEAADARGIGHLVVASNSGETALSLVRRASGKKIVCVTHAYGYKARGENELPDEMRQALTGAGASVLTTTHVLSGVERGVSGYNKGMYPAEIMSQTLRIFGQGTKVCVEISVMALDAGLVPYGERIIAIGGTERGADTAIVLQPAHANEIFRFKVHEIICKPSV